MHNIEEFQKELANQDSACCSNVNRGIFGSKNLDDRVKHLENAVKAQGAVLRCCNCHNSELINKVSNNEANIKRLNERIVDLESRLESTQQNGIGLSLIAAVCLFCGRC
jgi:hypothetical protein